jgi:hypothetical protein
MPDPIGYHAARRRFDDEEKIQPKDRRTTCPKASLSLHLGALIMFPSVCSCAILRDGHQRGIKKLDVRTIGRRVIKPFPRQLDCLHESRWPPFRSDNYSLKTTFQTRLFKIYQAANSTRELPSENHSCSKTIKFSSLWPGRDTGPCSPDRRHFISYIPVAAFFRQIAAFFNPSRHFKIKPIECRQTRCKQKRRPSRPQKFRRDERRRAYFSLRLIKSTLVLNQIFPAKSRVNAADTAAGGR